MNIRAFKSDKQALIEEGKRIIASGDDARFIRKVTIVNLLLNGASASSLSPSSAQRSMKMAPFGSRTEGLIFLQALMW